MPTWIDPKAPADHPMHPANALRRPEEEHFTPQAVEQSVDLARTLQAKLDQQDALRRDHTTTAEIDAGTYPDLTELEDRDIIAAQWRANRVGSGPEIIDRAGAVHVYGGEPGVNEGWYLKPDDADLAATTSPGTVADLQAALAALDGDQAP